MAAQENMQETQIYINTFMVILADSINNKPLTYIPNSPYVCCCSFFLERQFFNNTFFACFIVLTDIII